MLLARGGAEKRKSTWGLLYADRSFRCISWSHLHENPLRWSCYCLRFPAEEMSIAWDHKARMRRNQDCSRLPLALEIKEAHHHFFPVCNGNSRAGGGIFLRGFFLQHTVALMTTWLLLALSTWWPLSSIVFWMLCSSLVSWACLSGYCQTLPEASTHCGHDFISLLLFLSQCFGRVVHSRLHFFSICSLLSHGSSASPPLPLLNLPLRGLPHPH